MPKRRPCFDARKAFEKLLKERHPEFKKAPSELRQRTTYMKKLDSEWGFFIIFEGHSEGDAAFTLQIGQTQYGHVPTRSAGPRKPSSRFCLGELIDGKSLWWDLLPPVPTTAEERARMLPRLSPLAQMMIRGRPFAQEVREFYGDEVTDAAQQMSEDIAWDVHRAELVSLMTDQAYGAKIAGAARDALEKVERFALPWFARQEARGRPKLKR